MGNYSEVFGVILFVVITIVISIICNFCIKRTLIAVLLSTFLAPAFFILVTSFMNGYLDPFFQMVFVRSSAISFLISLVVGALFILKRRKITKA
jgi:hypothetical protein